MNNKVLTIVAGCLVAVAVFLAGLYVGDAFLSPYMDNKDEDAASAVAASFVADLTSNNVEAAYGATSSELQSEQTQEDFVKSMGDLNAGEDGSFQEPEVLRRGESYVYMQTVIGLPESKQKSTVGNFYISLSKEGGDWKVDAVTIQ